jgi:flagellar L-ring protein precursor FlgH
MRTFLLLLPVLFAGCAMQTPSTNVHQPMTVRPAPLPESRVENGAIYQPGTARLSLYEDRRAKFAGDTLTILIEEKTSASKKSSSAASRTSSTAIGVPTIKGLPGKSMQGLDIGATGANTFEGKGDSANDNTFTANLTVTVIDVFPNGNLLVSGEKQIAINQGTEFVRFSGVVNPLFITPANAVSSTKVADARMEYRGSGYVDEAQKMGWLQRFFLNVSPF